MEGNIQTTDSNLFSVSAHKQLWEHMNTIAKTLIESRAIPSYIQNSAQAMVVFETGHEMGLKFMESVKYLYIINGQVTLTGQGAARKLADSKYRVKYEEETDKCTAIVYMLDPEREIARETVTFAEAEASNYIYSFEKDEKGNKIKDAKTGEFKKNLKPGWLPGMNRKLKLRYLALSTVVKTHLPDVLGAAVDIKEVAEDYPVEEKVKEPLINAEQKADLNSFIKKAKDKKEGKVEDKKEEVQEGEIIEGDKVAPVLPTEILDKAQEATKAEKRPLTTEEVEKALDIKLGEAQEAAPEPKDPRFVSKQREFFATANELGLDVEKAKEEVKKYFGDKKHFADLSLMELTSYVRAMKIRLKQKQAEKSK